MVQKADYYRFWPVYSISKVSIYCITMSLKFSNVRTTFLGKCQSSSRVFGKSFPRYPKSLSHDYSVYKDLTLRRPLRQSWRLGVFSSSQGWALAAFPKRWKNIPHKSSTADFSPLFIFIQDTCWTHKTRLKILDCNFTYYGVYPYWTFCVYFCSITQKQVLKHL